MESTYFFLNSFGEYVSSTYFCSVNNNVYNVVYNGKDTKQ